MPFRRVAHDKYQTPSGRTYNQAQVNRYYANDGFTKKTSDVRRPTTTKKK